MAIQLNIVDILASMRYRLLFTNSVRTTQDTMIHTIIPLFLYYPPPTLQSTQLVTAVTPYYTISNNSSSSYDKLIN